MEEFKDEIVEETSTVADPAFANEDITPHKSEEEIKIPVLESLRNKFGKDYKVSRIVSYISSFIVVAIIIVAYTVIFPLQPNGTWAGIILIILTLIGSVVFSKWHRKKITATVKKYMDDYNGAVNEFALSDSKISNYRYDFAGEIVAETFTDARFLKDIINTNSRNLLSYDTAGFNVEVADFVAYRQEGKQAKAAFLGKLIHATKGEEINGRVVFYLKPDATVFKDAGGPDDIADLELIDDKPLYRLYATNKELKKKLPLRAINALLKIRPSDELADVTVVMHKNKVLVTLTYSDALMVVPYKEAIPAAAIAHYKQHLSAINDFFNAL